MRIREGIQDDVAVLKVAGHLMSRLQVDEAVASYQTAACSSL